MDERTKANPININEEPGGNLRLIPTMKTNKPKKPLSGAALQKHLTKQVKDLDDFNKETLRIIKDTERMKRRQKPLYRLTYVVGWGIASASLSGLLTCFVQPQYTTTGILCGFSLGLSGALLDK